MEFGVYHEMHNSFIECCNLLTTAWKWCHVCMTPGRILALNKSVFFVCLSQMTSLFIPSFIPVFGVEEYLTLHNCWMFSLQSERFDFSYTDAEKKLYRGGNLPLEIPSCRRYFHFEHKLSLMLLVMCHPS